MANLPLAFMELLVGGIFLTAGVTGDSLADVVTGKITINPLPGSSPSSGTSTAASGASSGALPDPSGATGSVISQTAKVLEAGGLNKTAAAGVIGNALQESTWNPAATADGGGGLWGFTSGDISLASLQAYAAQRGVSWTNPTLQAEFLLQHLSQSQIQTLNAQSSPEAAADWFMNNWEHPAAATENQARREQGARQAYQQIGGA